MRGPGLGEMQCDVCGQYAFVTDLYLAENGMLVCKVCTGTTRNENYYDDDDDYC